MFLSHLKITFRYNFNILFSVASTIATGNRNLERKNSTLIHWKKTMWRKTVEKWSGNRSYQWLWVIGNFELWRKFIKKSFKNWTSWTGNWRKKVFDVDTEIKQGDESDENFFIYKTIKPLEFDLFRLNTEGLDFRFNSLICKSLLNKLAFILRRTSQ